MLACFYVHVKKIINQWDGPRNILRRRSNGLTDDVDIEKRKQCHLDF